MVKEDDNLGEHVAGRILDENLVGVFGIAKDVPGRGLLFGHILGIVQDAGSSPHISDRIVVGVFAASVHLVEAAADIWRQVIVYIIGGGAEIAVQGKQEVAFEHPLDYVVGGADHVVIFVSFLDFGKHGLVDVEGLVDNLDLLPGLLLIPGLELGNDAFVDVIGPVINLENLVPVFGTCGQKQGHSCNRKDFLHYLDMDFAVLFWRMLNTTRRTRTRRKMIVMRGRSSGVRPPLRASV